MDHPHLSLARTLWAAVADADAEAIRLLLADDVLWRSAGNNPRSGEYRGPAGVLDYLATAGESVDELASSLDDIYVSEQGAVIGYHVSARRGAKRLEMDYLLRLRIRDGQIFDALVVPANQRGNDAFWK